MNLSCPACGSPQKKRVRSRLADVEARTPGEYGIAQCCDCRFLHLSPRPAESDLPACYPDTYYTRLAAKRSSLSRALYLPRLHFRRRRIQKTCGGIPASLLEVGYGDGTFLAHLKSRWGNRCRLTGIDFKPPRERNHLSGINLLEGDFLRFPFQTTHDVIVLYDVLEHLPRPVETLQRLQRLLNPGGWLILQVPNWNSAARHLFPRHWSGLQIPRHQSFLTPSSLERMISQTGLHYRQCRPVFDPGDLSVSFCNWISDGLHLRTPPRQSWFFLPATVFLAPLAFLQCAVFGNSGEMECVAQNPKITAPL